MNKKKKIQDLYNKRRKRARAKLDGRPKARYIAKADRVKTEVDAKIEDATIELDKEQSSNGNGNKYVKSLP